MGNSVFTSSLGADIDPTCAIDFYSGMISGLLWTIDLPLDKCIKSSPRLMSDIDSVLKNLTSVNFFTVIKAVSQSADIGILDPVVWPT